MGVFDLVGKAAKGAKKAAPFFSKADLVLDELPRGKGLGNEFLGELVKKGAKPTELRERGIEKALKDKPKMTKAEVQKIFESSPPPKVQEKVLTSEVTDYDEWLEAKAEEMYGVDYFDLRKDEQARLKKMYDELELTQYDKYKTPGGENYREILLKLPAFDDKRIMELEADIRRSENYYKNYNLSAKQKAPFQAKVEELARLKEQQAAAGAPYISSHYRTDPNLLAHIRVQDFKTPEGKKVLLVDEIQSDWHQEGRKKGYIDPNKKPYTIELDQNGVYRIRNLNGERFDPFVDGQRMSGFMTAEGAENAMRGNMGRLPQTYGVPDAPFKKNWHELAMKRVLDYAAENGYDTVAITPGAEQAKRYDLSKQVDELLYKRNDDGTYQLSAQTGGHGRMLGESVAADKLEDYVGKEIAQKIVGGEGSKTEVAGKYDPASMTSSKEYMQSLSGIDLQIGGEGMKGFYDKILPDYLNNFGKQYGASVGQMDLITKPEKKIVNIMDPDEPDISPAEMMKFHSFDITPQLRDEVKNKGLPLYSKTGMGPEGLAAGTGAATIGSEVFDANNEQQVQNPVHFTENPDAMLLELIQRN
jgi:hypothetical protein